MNPRSFPAFLLACLLVLSLAGVAAAHAELVESEPAQAGTIEAPGELRATFSIDLDPDPERSFIIVRNDAGEEVARGGVTPDDLTTMTVDLPALEPGEYRARWQARDPTDNHTERGTLNFTVVLPAATPTPLPATPTAAPPTDEPATPRPTAEPTPAPVSPSPVPSPTPGPTPTVDEPTAGMADLLMALVLAGAVIAGLAFYLYRRR